MLQQHSFILALAAGNGEQALVAAIGALHELEGLHQLHNAVQRLQPREAAGALGAEAQSDPQNNSTEVAADSKLHDTTPKRAWGRSSDRYVRVDQPLPGHVAEGDNDHFWDDDMLPPKLSQTKRRCRWAPKCCRLRTLTMNRHRWHKLSLLNSFLTDQTRPLDGHPTPLRRP